MSLHRGVKSIMSKSTRFLVILVSVMMMVGTANAQEKLRETYNMMALAMGTSNPPVMRPGTTANLQITIRRWSTDEERLELLTELAENGAEGLVKVLRKQEETGFVRVTGRASARNPFPASGCVMPANIGSKMAHHPCARSLYQPL